MQKLFCCCRCVKAANRADDDAVECVAYPPLMSAQHKGPGVSLQVNTVSGDGCSLCDTAVEQEAAYWEVTVNNPGKLGLGVMWHTNETDLSAVELGEEDGRWGFTRDYTDADVGKVLGICVDYGTLPMMRLLDASGDELASLRRVRGTVYPAVTVSGGAACTVRFTQFEGMPPRKCSALTRVHDMI